MVEEKDWGNRGHGQPVLMMHGHNMDSTVWFRERKAGKPLPLQLLDAGYDVWLGNNRGSFNNERKTARQTRNMRDFWDWSFAEMGTEDLPAFIRKIKEVTGYAKVSYVGYDQGAT